MSVDDHSDSTSHDQRGLSDDPTLLLRLAALFDVPAPSRGTWRAATLVLFASDPADFITIRVKHVQDLDWTMPEQALLQLAADLLHERAREIAPYSPPRGGD